jgi:hypothetical protein
VASPRSTPVQRADGEVAQQAGGVERAAVRQPQHERARRRGHRPAPAPPRGLRPQLRRRHAVHGAHGVVELPHAGEPGGERDVGHPERGRLDQQPRRVGAVRPGQGERPRAQLRGQHAREVPVGVAQPPGQPRHALALDDAVGDQPHRAGGQVGPGVPVGRAGDGVGQAAPARPEPALLGGGRGGDEVHVAALGRDGRAGRPAVDPGGAHDGDEVPVEPRVAGGQRVVAAVVVEEHGDDDATSPGPRLAGIGRDHPGRGRPVAASGG